MWLRLVALLLAFTPQAALPSERQDQVRFLPDEAEVACRALLPQCFRRREWARLCLIEPNIQKAFPVACGQAAQP